MIQEETLEEQKCTRLNNEINQLKSSLKYSNTKIKYSELVGEYFDHVFTNKGHLISYFGLPPNHKVANYTVDKFSSISILREVLKDRKVFKDTDPYICQERINKYCSIGQRLISIQLLFGKLYIINYGRLFDDKKEATEKVTVFQIEKLALSKESFKDYFHLHPIECYVFRVQVGGHVVFSFKVNKEEIDRHKLSVFKKSFIGNTFYDGTGVNKKNTFTLNSTQVKDILFPTKTDTPSVPAPRTTLSPYKSR